MPKHTVTAHYVDTCYPDYLQDLRGILVGASRAGQTRDELIAELADEVLDHDESPSDLDRDAVRDAISDCFDLPEGGILWPVDGDGNEIRPAWHCLTCSRDGAGDAPDACPSCLSESDDRHGPQDSTPEAPEEQPSLWVRVKVESEPMRITLSQSDDDDGTVTAFCDDVDAARHDQSIDGSRWECPRDLDVAYAALSDRPSLVDDLQAAGYDVDDSEYTAPDQSDVGFWHAKYERENDAAPDALRKILGWTSLDDVRATRRVSEEEWRWSDGPGPRAIGTFDAYVQACWDAGIPLDDSDYPDMRTRFAPLAVL